MKVGASLRGCAASGRYVRPSLTLIPTQVSTSLNQLRNFGATSACASLCGKPLTHSLPLVQLAVPISRFYDWEPFF
jgi:hypothetical protein